MLRLSGVLGLAGAQVNITDVIDKNSSGNETMKERKRLKCGHLSNLGVFITKKRQQQQQNPPRSLV